jgi:PAS domain S-box-containing protein
VKRTSVGSRILAHGSGLFNLGRFFGKFPDRSLVLCSFLACMIGSPETPQAELLRGDSWELGVPTNGRSEFLTGLPQISAIALAKDADGFLWIGTQNGLARFDGTQFQVFNSVNTNALDSSWVNALHVDSRGQLWIGTTEEVAVYRDHQFRRMTRQDEKRGSVDFTETPDGKVWIAGDTLRFAQDGAVYDADFYQGDAAALETLGKKLLIQTRDNQLFEYSDDQLIAIDARLWRNQTLMGIWRFRDQLLLLTDNSVVRLLTEGGRWHSEHIDLPHNVDVRLLAVSENEVVAIARGGTAFELHNPLSEPQWRALPLPVSPSINIDPKVALLEPGPTLWIGTQASGLWNVWSNGIEREAEGKPITETFAWSFFVDETVYVATDAGVFRRENASQWPLYVPAASIDNSIAYSYWHDATGQFVGTRSGLYWRKDDTREFEKLSALGDRQINSIVEIEDQLWLATSAGLFVRESGATDFRLIEGTDLLSVRAIIKDVNDILWLGTESGIYRWVKGELAMDESPILRSVFVTAMIQVADGWIIAGSYGEGMFVRNPHGQWRHINTPEGLPFPNLFSFTMIDDSLWASSDKGLLRLDVEPLLEGTVLAQVVMRDDGAYQSRNRLRCCNGAGHRRAVVFDDKLFLPTLEGVVSVDLNQPPRPEEAPIITGIWQGDEAFQLTDDLQLGKDQRSLEITFTTPHLATGELPEFRYRMGSNNEDWVYTSGRRAAFFTNIASGQPVFELQSKLGASDWMSAEPLHIKVQPYFYETWFARALMLAGLMGIIWLAIRYRTDSFQRRAEELERAVAEATQALADTARDGQRLIHEANAPIVTLTENGSIFAWNRNAEKLTGFNFSDVAGQNIGQVLVDGSPKMDPEGLFKRLHRGDAVDSLRISFSNKEGRRITLLMGGTLLPASKDTPERVVLVGQDLTEYLEREQQLVQASKMSTLGEMATGMAHELNQPLNIIRLTLLNITNIMEKKPEKMDQVPAKLERINEQVDRAAKIIDHMRRFGRRAEMPSSGEHQQFDPEQAVTSAATLFREQLGLDGIKLNTELNAPGVAVSGDPLLLEQVIMNLLSNSRDAIKEHTRAGDESRVTINTTLSDDRFVVSVEDSGGGASEATLKTMFEPFFTTKEPGKGTGLGLSISYSTINSMSGEIKAENTEHGLKVSISLPLS